MRLAYDSDFEAAAKAVQEALDSGTLVRTCPPLYSEPELLRPWEWRTEYWAPAMRSLAPEVELEVSTPETMMESHRRSTAVQAIRDRAIDEWTRWVYASEINTSGVALPEHYPGRILDPAYHPGHDGRCWRRPGSTFGWCAQVVHGRYPADAPIACYCGARVATYEDSTRAALCPSCLMRLVHAQQALPGPHLRRGISFEHPDSAQYRDHIPGLKDWARAPRGTLLLSGPTGLGKTSAAISTLRWAVWHGWSGKFIEMLTLQQALDKQSTLSEIDRKNALWDIETASLLVIDDFAAASERDWIWTEIMDLLMRRHAAGRAMILTSNFHLEDMPSRLPARIVSRVAEMTGGGTGCVRFDGRDLRWRA